MHQSERGYGSRLRVGNCEGEKETDAKIRGFSDNRGTISHFNVVKVTSQWA